MVQEKDAAKKRVQARKDWLQNLHDDIEKRTVRFKWQVIEHTPGYNTGGYYDQDVPAKNVVVKDDCKTEEEANAWMDAHEPDPGKKLLVQRRRLVKNVTYSWI